MRRDRKYVLHIPLEKFDGNLVTIDIDGILEDLIIKLEETGSDSFYITRVESHYKTRKFDEILITVFAEDSSIEHVFSEWFRKNNHELCQEAFAYEIGNEMIIEKF